MKNVVVRSVVLLGVSTVIVLVSIFVFPPAGSPASASQEASHAMAGMGEGIASEADFISGMIPHHQEAVESARAVLQTTERPQLRQLAEDVVKAQTAEITTLKDWLTRWYPNAPAADYTPMMTAPSGMSAPAADRAFLEGMVGHHQGATEMARAYLKGGFAKHPEVVALAKTIVRVQGREIGQMQGWLEAWYGSKDRGGKQMGSGMH